jgi:hypothetical protein
VSSRERLRAGGKDDVAVIVQTEAWVVSDLQGMSVEITEGSDRSSL